MTKVNLRLFLLAGAAASTAFAAAQTSTTHHTSTAAHHTATHTAAHPAARTGCAQVPTLSPKIPTVPAGTSCPKAIVAVSETITFSPLVGPELKAMFPASPMSFALAYQEIHVGTGEPARPHMYYTVKYTGYLLDGTKFDSSEDHPEIKEGISFPYGAHRVIPGWDMGFEGMRLGGKRRLFVPYQLAYGERGNPRIPPKSELIFDMELVSQSASDPHPPLPRPPAGNPGAPGAPGAPTGPPGTTTLPATPPTGKPGAQPQTPPSAQPQNGPDVKPAPPTPGTPSTPQTQPPTPKQPPPSGI